MTLLKELIVIPEAVQTGDFVMSLAAGVAQGASTLDQYVVTPQLAEAYDDALRFIASAITERRSKAAYLDGSFGSGKSHFMAVLHLILQHNPQALAIHELSEPIAATDAVLGSKSFELVPFHMIGAESMEQAIFGGYVKHVSETNPGGVLPGVYTDGPLFKQAETSRAQFADDERFFAVLNDGAKPGGGGWGALEAAWDPDSFTRARNAPVGDPERGRLGAAIVKTLLPGYAQAMSGNATGYVDFDTGLAELARHAHGRGKHGLVLFLDELILWLGSRIRDTAFVEREGQKLIKLIEYTHERPIPIISFVARQRDLRDFVGDLPGADQLSFADALKHWNDRFHRISLADRNLSKIAERRLLQPKGEAERLTIDEAFAKTERTSPQTLDVLMTADGTREQFRETYPFSPAFMDTLVAASSVLQRERTALRVMLQLLVARRNDLAVGDLVSVGDLFDILASGDEPFSDDLKRHFAHARDLYRDQFRPILLERNGVSEADATSSPGFRTDDRLVKTLLLAALVPGAAPLRNLDVARLTALNHGSISSPIKGGERSLVLGKLRAWNADVGALKVGDDPSNPSVVLRLTGVDIDSIIERAAHVDNDGERRRTIRDLVLGELGVSTEQRLFSVEHPLVWRGTRRQVDVVFGNVRDTVALPDDALLSSGGRWKVVVDYPFDAGHSPLEDLDRLERWREQHGPSDTVCWVPAFFSASLQRDLGKLVVIEHLLAGDRLDQFADHLSAADRVQARGLLADQRSALQQRVKTAIRQAYGVERAAPETIDVSHGIEDRIQSLRSGLTVQVPIGATLADAFGGLLRQLLDHQFPQHPRIEVEYRAGDLRKVLEVVEAAAQTEDGRIPVPTDKRKVMRAIATPLQLGQQYEEPFVLGTTWRDTFERRIAQAAQAGSSTTTVGDLRRWIDEPEARGLPRDLQNLVILTYAAHSSRVFRHHGGPVTPTLERLDDDDELVSPQLPDRGVWDAARARAAAVFGMADVNPARSSFETLAVRLKDEARSAEAATESLVAALEARCARFSVAPETSARLRSARAARGLTRALNTTDDALDVVRAFADFPIDNAQHLSKALKSAASVTTTLRSESWSLLEVAADRGQEPGFTQVVTRVRGVLTDDEFAAQLAPVIQAAYEDTVRLVQPNPKPKPKPEPKPGVRVSSDHRESLSVSAARQELERLAQLDGEIEIALSWTITTRDG
ncbi:hypothetical protein OJ998_12015 [Solirubrobacter taibaiensis]|nr:hypothetical protein [Solirubrobacter taibaiensis]